MPAAAAEPTTLRGLAATTLATNVATVAFSFITVIVIGRTLGPRGRGEEAAFQLIPAICALIFALGLPHVATYFAAVHPCSAGSVVQSSVSVAVILGVSESQSRAWRPGSSWGAISRREYGLPVWCTP